MISSLLEHHFLHLEIQQVKFNKSSGKSKQYFNLMVPLWCRANGCGAAVVLHMKAIVGVSLKMRRVTFFERKTAKNVTTGYCGNKKILQKNAVRVRTA